MCIFRVLFMAGTENRTTIMYSIKSQDRVYRVPKGQGSSGDMCTRCNTCNVSQAVRDT